MGWFKRLFSRPKPFELKEPPDSHKYDPEIRNVTKLQDPKTYVGSLEYYAHMYQRCHLTVDNRATQESWMKHILKGRPEYEKVQAEMGVPWYLVGAIHGLEASFNWKTYLHNGDQLGSVTTRVPKGIGPIYDWYEAAIDSLKREGAHKEYIWTTESILKFAERYNGTGYLKKYPKHMSPYLWASTTNQTKGRYVQDHVFDENAVNKRVGVAAVMKNLERDGLIHIIHQHAGLIKP